MGRLWLFLTLATCFGPAAQAALLVISEGHGEVNRQYFEAGEFVLMRGDLPAMGVDREGNCWFVQHRRVVFDACERMLQAVDGVREDLMAGLSAEDRAVMERAAEVQNRLPPATTRPSGEARIAGYQTECHRVGERREICISAVLLEEIRAEMGDSRFFAWFRRFGEAAGELGGNDPETRAVAALAARGFPMLDRRWVESAPGIDPEILQSLPQAQRARIVAGIGDPGEPRRVRETRVTGVDRWAEMPQLDLSRYPQVGFEQYMQQTLGR